jgi:mono/diheme cytochrome c family protein
MLGALGMAAVLAAAPAVTAGAVAPGDAGALLYDTHCIACHTEKVHWRSAKRVTDWTTLVKEVRRWQASAGLSWGDDDVAAVARHLNALFYRFPEPRATG